MARVLLINPNTNTSTTDAMLSIAREAAPAGVEIEGITARFGADLIEVEETLGTASHAVAEILTSDAAGYDGVVIAAFGDPGLERSPKELNVVGIAEAGMHAAAEEGRRFSIVTTTSGLSQPIKRLVRRYGLEKQFASLRFTEGLAAPLMGNPEALATALKKAASEARDLDGAEAVVIGGGPLARAAKQLVHELALPIIEPVPEAIRLVTQRIATR
jgi:allantoin racemase